VPVLALDADMVDAQNWDHDAMVNMMEAFLCERGVA
jgi:hypothetical protein